MKTPIYNFQVIYFFLFFLFIKGNSLKAQEVCYGVKGGIEFNFSGKLSSSRGPFSIIETTQKGWQAGAFVLIDFPSFFLQPEITYSYFRSAYTVFGNKNLTYQNDRLNLEVLVGKNFLDFFRIFIGPAIYFNLRDNLHLQRASSISKNKAGIAFELGLGIKYLFITADIKYQRALYHYQNYFSYNNQTYTLIPKSNLLSLSLGVVF